MNDVKYTFDFDYLNMVLKIIIEKDNNVIDCFFMQFKYEYVFEHITKNENNIPRQEDVFMYTIDEDGLHLNKDGNSIKFQSIYDKYPLLYTSILSSIIYKKYEEMIALKSFFSDEEEEDFHSYIFIDNINNDFNSSIKIQDLLF